MRNLLALIAFAAILAGCATGEYHGPYGQGATGVWEGGAGGAHPASLRFELTDTNRYLRGRAYGLGAGGTTWFRGDVSGYLWEWVTEFADGSGRRVVTGTFDRGAFVGWQRVVDSRGRLLASGRLELVRVGDLPMGTATGGEFGVER